MICFVQWKIRYNDAIAVLALVINLAIFRHMVIFLCFDFNND